MIYLALLAIPAIGIAYFGWAVCRSGGEYDAMIRAEHPDSLDCSHDPEHVARMVW